LDIFAWKKPSERQNDKSKEKKNRKKNEGVGGREREKKQSM
jgi:hypothetical protein